MWSRGLDRLPRRKITLRGCVYRHAPVTKINNISVCVYNVIYEIFMRKTRKSCGQPSIFEKNTFLEHHYDLLIDTRWARKKIIFCSQNNKSGCILTQLLMERKHGEALGHGFYGSVAKRAYKNSAKIIQKKSQSSQRAVTPSPLNTPLATGRREG